VLSAGSIRNWLGHVSDRRRIEPAFRQPQRESERLPAELKSDRRVGAAAGVGRGELASEFEPVGVPLYGEFGPTGCLAFLVSWQMVDSGNAAVILMASLVETSVVNQIVATFISPSQIRIHDGFLATSQTLVSVLRDGPNYRPAVKRIASYAARFRAACGWV
jgi:hypothetical protein